MNKIVLVFVFAFLTGCAKSDGDYFSAIEKAYPGAEIKIAPNETYSYLVRQKDGTTLKVRPSQDWGHKFSSEVHIESTKLFGKI
jgi:hypothetical protein